MKQTIYQKLLLSLAIATFFVALTSAQVMDRNQVSPEMIEMKKKAKAEGLKAIPAERTKEAKLVRKDQIRSEHLTANSKHKTMKKAVPARRKATAKKATLDREVLVKEKQIATKKSPFEVAAEINEKARREGSGARASVIEVGGKHYVQLQPEETVKFEIKNQ